MPDSNRRRVVSPAEIAERERSASPDAPVPAPPDTGESFERERTGPGDDDRTASERILEREDRPGQRRHDR